MLALTRPSVDLHATLGALRRGGGDPTVRMEPGAVWWATRTPLGPGTLRVREGVDGVRADAWGPGAEWLLDGVGDLLGDGDDVDGFVPLHDVVADAHRRWAGLRIGRSRRVASALVSAILGQRITSMEAARQWRTLCRRFGGPAPGPFRLHLPPDPVVLAEMPYWAFHRFGIERRRADTIRRVAACATRIEETVDLPLADAVARLGAITGVGSWTVASVAGTALGDADAVPVGDYHLPHIVSWALCGERRGDDDRMLELLEPYRGHRGRVVRLLMLRGAGPPRRAPRQAIPPTHAW